MPESVSIGIDLGGTHLRAALITGAGAVHARRSSKTAKFSSALQLTQALNQLHAELLALAKDNDLKVGSAGVAIPGTVYADGTIATTPNLPFLDGCNLVGKLDISRSIPTFLCNDADAAALAEATFGAGSSFDSFLMVTLGTGVGGALILNGQLWRGADGMAGEIGHLVVDPHGRACRCGSLGCLEQYASASGIVLTARELLPTDPESLLHNFKSFSAADIAAAAIKGDNIACAAFAEAGRKLGQTFAGVAVNLLNLDGVIVGGGVAPSLDLMRPALENDFYRRAFTVQARSFEVRAAELGDDAGLVGSALYAKGLQHAS